ncbi:MAG: hypothetical protein LBQ54_11380, partial [Planctomycetaceae bacterium]|nr:hypothetical protein [Planctomycetaceae bacterium]
MKIFVHTVFLPVIMMTMIVCFPAMSASEEIKKIMEFDFESGDLQKEGWIIAEGQNTKPIGNRDREYNADIPYVKHSEHYLTTLETSANDRPTDDTVCVLESPVFVLNGNEAKFQVGGGKRPGTYVGLCPVLENGSIGEPVRIARGQDSEKMIDTVWDVTELKGQSFVLQVVDKETGGWAHIRMDWF